MTGLERAASRSSLHASRPLGTLGTTCALTFAIAANKIAMNKLTQVADLLIPSNRLSMIALHLVLSIWQIERPGVPLFFGLESIKRIAGILVHCERAGRTCFTAHVNHVFDFQLVQVPIVRALKSIDVGLEGQSEATHVSGKKCGPRLGLQLRILACFYHVGEQVPLEGSSRAVRNAFAPREIAVLAIQRPRIKSLAILRNQERAQFAVRTQIV